MDTIFLNSRNSKTLDPHKMSIDFLDKINIKRNDKFVALLNLSIYYTWKNIKTSYKNNKFKTLSLTWNEEFELSNESYYLSVIQDEYILITKNGEKTDNPSIRIYVNKTENRIMFKIKTRYYLKLLTPETMKLLGSTKTKISKDENGKNVPHL